MTAMSGNTMLFNNVYTYDKVDNILSITNNVPIPTQGLGGRTSSRFEYDEWNRLIFAEGSVATARNQGSFTLNMEYDKLFNIRRKNQFVDMANAPSSLTHDFHYFYNCPSGPNRPSQIGSKLLEFDANGNPIVIHDTATGDFRRMIWDEENRLMFLSDNGNMHHFVYDHRGERVIKSNSGLQNVFMDGLPVGTLENNRRTVIYVSPYFVMRDGGFTKHYFAGTQRVLSKLGTGRFHNRFTPSNRVITAGNKNYIQRQQQLRQGLYDPMRELQIPPGNPTQRPNITRPDYTGQPRPTIVGNYEIPRGWPRQPTTAPPGGPPGPPIQWGPEITNDNVRAGYTYLPNALKETAQFFFHPDHLGSTTLITDRHGNITQFITLMPFGELLVSEHLTARNVPFLFTGKEMDSETGLYYFGYRYFDPRLAIWLGVDPLWEWYPHIGGFVYTANNPIRFIDPDGRQIAVAENVYGGQTSITINFNAGLINDSRREFTPEQMQAIADRLTESIQSSFTGSEGNVSWNTTVNINVVSSDNPLAQSDHAIRITDMEGTTVGRAAIGGRAMEVSSGILDNVQATEGQFGGTGRTATGGATLERTGAHEFGHSAGLNHPATGTMDGNLMHQTRRPNAGMGITEGQIRHIQREYSAGRLNRGGQTLPRP